MAEQDTNRTMFDKSGQYDAGLKSLMRMLRLAFGFLLILIIGMTVYFFTFGGYFAVRPQEAVIVLRFGKFHDVYTSDWHWFFPTPVSEFIRIRTSSQTMNINFLPDEAVMMDGSEQGRPLTPGRDSYLLTGDANIVHSAWEITYVITDPRKYYETLLTPANPLEPDKMEVDPAGYAGTRGARTMLQNTFRQAANTVTASERVDILYTARRDYSVAVERLFAQLVLDLDCGVAITQVELIELKPPLKTKPAFDEVAAAHNVQDSLRIQAQEYQVNIENEAKTTAAEIIAQANIYKRQVAAEVQAESQYFREINQAYRDNPQILMTLYNDMLAEVMVNQKNKFILGTRTDPSRKQVRLRINPEVPRPVNPATSEEQ